MLARIAAKASCLLLLLILSVATKAQLKTNFSATPTSQCAPAVIQFSDLSTGNPTQWKWDLGNGTTSFLQNPSAAYLTPGTYTVKLIIKNGAQSDSLVKTSFITVYALPAAQFTSNTTAGCYPLPVKFTDQSAAGSGTVTNWQWDFGDGFTSNDQSPMHTYTNAGNFNVTLQVTNSNGCTNTISKTQYIKINAGVDAGFTNTTPGTCKPPITISFQNTSTGTGVLNYQWDFGDGNTSSAPNPTYSYNLSGNYTVKLIATNSTGCADTVIKTNAIDIGSVHAAFTSATSTTCLNNSISFKNTSAPTPTSLLWDFGDGTNSTATNPVKTYTTPGTYAVKMLANFGACMDSAQASVTILPKPTAAFTASDTAFCQTPDTVNFTNQVIGGTNYQWSFGDGTTSSAQSPSHIYTNAGAYDVTLITTNAGGCADTLKKTAYIKIQPPTISFAGNLPDSGCVPFTKSFSSKITTADSIVSYLWNFGDGNTSTLPTPTYTYNNPGSYTITLTITTVKGCTTTASIQNGVVASIRPVANFSADPLNTCAKTIVNFADQSTLDSTHWFWTFGDGANSVLQNPTHIYIDTGFFNVQLIAYNHGCSDTIQFMNYIYIKPPIAKFVVAADCDYPYVRVFTDKSIGADQWNWDFGDGSTSTLQNPTHTYTNTGTFTVTLTVINNTTGCDFSKQQTVTIVVTKAVFYAADTVVCKGNPVAFNAPIPNTGDVVSYLWNFGDGTSGTTSVNATSHTYTVSDLYTVSLIITNTLGCKDTLTKPQYIRVNGPTAKFTVTTPGNCLNSSVIFSDNSVSDGIHPIQTWVWSYGDGHSDTLTAPPFQHLYTATGTYNVSLTVIDSSGCSNTYKLPTSLIISKPHAAFSTIDTLTCPNQPVIFSDGSTGTNLSYLWDFGDATNAVTATPTHSYSTDGAYTIKLSLTDKYGCTDSLTRIEYVNVQTPMANFTMSDSQTTCPPLLVAFTNKSVNTDSVSWNFGDSTTSAINNPSHFYTYPGVYIVTLTVASPGGCISQLQKKVTILGPTGTFAYVPLNGCSPVNINFLATAQNTHSILWDFSDGTTLDTVGTQASHSYTHSGAYLPKMILSDSLGCHVAIQGLDTINIFKANAKFNFPTNALCDSGIITFKDSSTSNDIITGYNWSFGDGDSSVSQNPMHQFTKPGLYYPELTVTTKIGCSSTLVSTAPVRIVASPKVSIIAPGNGCIPLNATFKGQMLAADTSAITWAWSFGNGNISTLQIPTQQTYSKGGVYPIKLKATNSTGCFDTVSTSIEAYALPVINAGNDITICVSHGQTLTASGATTYAWSPAAGLSCVSCASPVTNPAVQTEYFVTGTTVHGCTATDSVNVAVKYPFAMRYSPPDTLCEGSSARLSASGANTYVWTPQDGLDNATSASPNARPTSTTTYRVIGTDDHACFSDTGFVTIKVYPIPTVDAGPDKTINVGQSIDLVPTISNDVTSVIWSPTGAIARSAYPGITVQPTQTTQYRVDVKNDGGCAAHDDVTIYVVCNGGNVFVPNTFSPNGDGVNDIFYPRGTGLFKIKTLRIFDRWGEMVFENQNFNPNDPGNGWNGLVKGAKVTPDVYVYIIDIICDNNSVLTFSGNVALIQ